MIPLFDQATQNLIDGFTPRWTALRVERDNFSGLDAHGFKCETILFVGQPSLLCGIDPKDFPGISWEYFPIRCDIVDESIYGPEDVTLARTGGQSDFDRKMQWLFETTSLTLTDGDDEFLDSIASDAKHYEFAFYNGLLISDPKGRGSLCLTVSNTPDFVITAELTFGPDEP
jgi:hypothetical protein